MPKPKKFVFRSHGKRGKDAQLSAPHHDIERVTNITALGVVINDRLPASDHVSYTLAGCTSLHYAFRVLHGLPEQSLKDVFRATVIAQLDSRTVEKQNEQLSATAVKYSSELKFAYGRVRVRIRIRVRLGRPYAWHRCVYAYGRPYAQNFVTYAHGRLHSIGLCQMHATVLFRSRN